jgi:UDP-N-acetylglucosamine/UDP-N-acetylgalactosamine 4-epimerase
MSKYEEVLQHIRRKPRRWLVTGAAGFIGSNLVEHLLNHGQSVTGLDNFSTGSRSNLNHVKNAVGAEAWKRMRFIEGDIRSLDTCRQACDQNELVLHQAALGSVPRSIDDPLSSNDSNINGFLNMLTAARDAKVGRMVYASSSAIYGDHPALPKIEPVIGRPLSPYGLTKGVNEQYAGVFAECYGFRTIGLRYFNVFGPRQNPDGEYSAVISAWIGALLRGQPAYVNGDGKNGRDFCYVENVVQANLLAATADESAANHAYNIALGEQTTLNELFEMIRLLLVPRMPQLASVRPVHREPRRGDVRFSQADISKAKKMLGFRPTHRVLEGLEKTVDWYVANLAAAGAPREVAHA